MGSRITRAALSAHVRTWRPYTLWYVGLVGLAGETLAAADTSPARMLVAWLVPTLVWVAAHYLADYLDRDLDAVSKPHRPIPSGQLRPATALASGAVLAAAGCGIALVANWRTAGLLVVALAGAYAYNGFLKARGIWGNLVRGSLTAAVFVFGTMVATPLPPVALLPFLLVFWAHDAASNLVGAMRDIAGDREGGYATYAVRRGPKAAARTSACLYALAIALALAFGLAVVEEHRAAAGVTLAVAAALGARAFGLLFAAGSALTPRTALRAHGVLVVERLILAAALLVPGAGPVTALAVLVPALLLTVTTQRAMRARHEFPDPCLSPQA